MPNDPSAPALGAQHSADEKREAFAVWDRYKEQRDQAIRDMVPNVPVRGQNPLFPIIFADGYLRGKAAQAARLAAMEAERDKYRDMLNGMDMLDAAGAVGETGAADAAV